MDHDQEEQQDSRYEQERARMREMEDRVSALAAQITDLGIASQDTFMNAASSLFGWGLDGARRVLEETHPPYQDPLLHERIVETIAEASPGQSLRRLYELQAIATAFARTGAHSRQIASYAMEMGENVDRDLQVAFAPIYMLLFSLVQQAFVELRGSVMISNARDTTRARRLLEEDSQMDLLYLRLQRTVQQAIDYNPLRSYLFHQTLLVGARIKDIGDEVRAICRALLHDPAL